MGYSAQAKGYIDFLTTEENWAEVNEDVKTILEEVFYDVYISRAHPLSVEISDDSIYYEDDVKKALVELNKEYKISAGEIEFVGEDNEMWHFIYKNDNWYEENGYVSYNGSPSYLVTAPWENQTNLL